jgi:hypothetical protein
MVGIMPLPHIVDYDTLLLAPALVARGGAVQPVVDELLTAANEPDRLQGIDPTLTRVRAADLLSLEHDPALLGDAVAILREAVALALPGEVEVARDALAKTTAEQGNLDELEAIARALLREPPSLTWAHQLTGISAVSAIFGYGKQAASWLDEAVAGAASGSGGPGRSGRPDRTIRPALDDAKKRLAQVRAVMTADGCDPDDPVAARARMWTRPAAAATVGSYPPWPAGLPGSVVWWPEPEYARLTRNLPEMSSLLGERWRDHTAMVQAAMTERVSLAAGPHSLVAADFGQFAGFLEWSRADPLAPSTMTAFGALRPDPPAPVRWPPKHRAPCWCGTGNRYQGCCLGREARDQSR